ncbi:MAG: sulfur transferase domain-containing protein [Puniceicoccaceae bacterium]
MQIAVDHSQRIDLPEFVFTRLIKIGSLSGFISLLILMLASCQSPVTNTIEPVSLGGMKKLHQVGNVYLGSQPGTEDLRLLKQKGVRTVINLRHESEQAGFDEKEAVEEQGMRYIHIPFNGGEELTDEVLDEAIDSLAGFKEPALMHCASSNRVGAVWMAFRIKEHGLEYDAALEEARTAGLRSEAYIERVREYIDQ